jgi:hypothetical protein
MKKILLFFLLCKIVFASVTKEDVRKIIKEENMILIHYIDKRFDAVDKRFEGVDKRFEGVDKRFDAVDKRFDAVDKRFDAVDKKFNDMQKRMDKRFDEMQAQMNRRFEEVNHRFDDFKTFFNIITAIFTSLTIGVIGFAYWDRRTIIREAKKETIEEIEKEGKVVDLVRALKELSKKDKELALILRNYGFL